MASLNSSQILSPPQARSRWLAIVLFLLALAAQASNGGLILAGCTRFADADLSETIIVTIISSGLAFSILGSLIVFYQPHNRIGWLCLWIGIGLSSVLPTHLYVACGLAGHIAAPGLAYVAWFEYSFDHFLTITPLFILLPMLYPTGRFLSPRWRWLTSASLIVIVVASIALGLLPDFSQDNGSGTLYPLANPFDLAQLPAWWYAVFRNTLQLTIIFLCLAGIASMILRLKRSVGDERQQMKWLAYFLATAVIVQLLIFELPGAFLYPQIFETIWYSLIILVVFLGFPLTIGIAIFKYRLYAIDIIINRTLVYGGLTLLITTAYVLLVGGLGTLAANQSGQVIGLVLATAIVVVGIRPLHRALQMNVNRFVAASASPSTGEFKGKQTTESTKILPPLSLPLLGEGANASPPTEVEITKTSLPVRGGEGGKTTHTSSFPPPNTENLGKPIPNTPPDPRLRWLAIALFLVVLMALLALALLVLAGCASFSYLGTTGISISFASGMAFSTLGVLILTYRPSNRIGWLCLWIGIGLPCVNAISIYANCGIAGHIAAPGLAYLAWFSYSFGVFFPLVPMFILLPMLYPTGKFLSPCWQWITVAGLLVVTINGAAIGLLPDLSQDNGFETLFTVANPFGISHLPEWWYSFFSSSSNLTIITLSLVGITAMVVRFRRSVGDERQQMKWLAYFLGTAVVVQLLFFELPGAFFYPEIFSSIWYNLIIIVVFLGFPIIIGIAIFKYRLYAIDVVINRTLVYGGLTLAVVLIYTLTVGGLGLLFQTSGNFIISLLATALIAIAF